MEIFAPQQQQQQQQLLKKTIISGSREGRNKTARKSENRKEKFENTRCENVYSPVERLPVRPSESTDFQLRFCVLTHDGREGWRAEE